MDAYGNPVYSVPGPAPSVEPTPATGPHQYYTITSHDLQQPQQAGDQMTSSVGDNCTQSNITSQQPQSMSKADSHAVLMELFARDQDLVRQATESARLKAESKQQQTQNQQQQSQNVIGQASSSQMYVSSQQPMKAPGLTGSSTSAGSFLSNSLQNVPSLSSWPHFSSITSLNNLGNIPGVKSIASLSGADLASKGSLNKMGNLAQVKSVESMMGKNDSYAFLEVFFCDRSSNNLSGMSTINGTTFSKGGMKSESSEDNEIGLSLEDESPIHPMNGNSKAGTSLPIGGSGNTTEMDQQQLKNRQGVFFTVEGMDITSDSGGTLKRAYDDVMAAHGLISVRRSSEKLTDLELPEKIQRTLSQEFIIQNQQQQQLNNQTYTSISASYNTRAVGSSQYPGQQPIEPAGSTGNTSYESASTENKDGSDHIQVSANTLCLICNQPNVDTQLRPCGHMFHDLCLKPSLQNPTLVGIPPKCPVDATPIRSYLLAIPDVSSGNSSSAANNNILPSSYGSSDGLRHVTVNSSTSK